MLNRLTTPHEYPGKLFVVEGIDGSGKTTQLGLLAKWLSAAGRPVVITEWNSSALVKAATKAGKKKNALTPMTFSLLHATDFADRLLYNIIPPLKAGMIVLADRYAYTAFARDTARGVGRKWVRELYSFAVRPDLAVYFRVPIAQFNDPSALQREVAQGFTETFDSGAVRIGNAGDNGAGTLRGSALEGSNVDIADEFSKMIVTQRAFSANTPVITTADEMLADIINIKR